MIARRHGPPDARAALHERIRDAVRQIPPGRVATYGQVALVAGASTPRLVGRVLAELAPGSDVPWHRVLNSQGRVSARADGGDDPQQRSRLRAEGVTFDRTGRVNFTAVGWSGPSWEWLEANGFDIEDLILRGQRRGRMGAWINWDL